ncbi:hypothetical protein ABW19_dt0210025 [Dactylella cylindrospora]|nr:hypothetical protein ABW19_dt0210025 [Dactylella cylindrospora]
MGRQLNSGDYSIGWISPLPSELATAVAMLDELHGPPRDKSGDIVDDNIYKFGRIGDNNIVIACLPSGIYGKSSTTSVATKMRHSFPSITVGLLVGIAGGAPLPERDIRLGDVVVCEPVAGYGAVLEYDFGKTVQSGRFVHTKVLNKPPEIFLKAINSLKSEPLLGQRMNIDDRIIELLENGIVSQEFARPSNSSDQLFQSHYDHPDDGASCDRCEPTMVVERPQRSDNQPCIHYGLIASADQVMRFGATRDNLSREKNVLCFEMEAAGLMDILPSLVIRGICDYSDSHKNKIWQPYAALSAAVFAKKLLLRLPPIANFQSSRVQEIKLNLPVAKGAAFGSFEDQHEPECLPGTRVDLLTQITQWTNDPPENSKGILWLVGRAGTGKSTISRTVARSLQHRGQLGASFFFKRSEASRSNSAQLFTTIAHQLAVLLPCIALSIQKAIQSDPDIPRKALKEQFDKLILRPLFEANLPTHGSGLILLVDALDECEGKEDVKLIIYLLTQLKDIRVRVFLTSRPDLPILPTFKRLSVGEYKDIILHNVPKIEDDISLFLENELSKIREERYLPQEWPGRHIIEELTKRAIPLFIYAATLCRFIGDDNWDPEEQIKVVLADYNANWQESQLHKTYLPILNQLLVGQNDTQKQRLVEEFQNVVGTIINLASPLSTSHLAQLLSISESTIRCRLRPLHSVLDVPENSEAPVRTFHLSFRDFLLDRSVKGNLFWIDEKQSHQIIARKCIELLSDASDPRAPGLKRDICNLNFHGILRSEIDERVIEKYLPPAFQYACRYWVYHLARSGYQLTDNDETHIFLRTHILHWLEATSLLNITLEALKAVDVLKSITDATGGKSISMLIDDIKRFTLQNRNMISRAPLQTYVSALIFAPGHSIVRNIFSPEKMIPWISQLPLVPDRWGACLQTLEGQFGVNSITFSYNSTLLTLASTEEKAVKIWDAATGALLQTLEGHTGWVHSVAFSFNGNIPTLASASWDSTIRLWNAASGILLQTLKGHKEGVTSVAFSSDGKMLASASNESIRIWDTATGALLYILEGHTREVLCVAFSFNGKIPILASASGDYTIKIWDVTFGTLLRTIEEHNTIIVSMASSPDGKKLALASIDGKVQILDMDTGVLVRELTEHTSPVSSAVFSPNGKIIASSDESTIRLWDATSGMLLQTLRGHRGPLESLAFSPDGKFLASASVDKTVQIWDTVVETPFLTEERNFSTVDMVEFSPDGQTLASAMEDGTVLLWNIATKALPVTLRKDCGMLSNITFSPDGQTLALVTADSDILLWNIATRILRTIPKVKHYLTFRVVFSPDGEKLASGHEDSTVRLWDIATKALLVTLPVGRHTALSTIVEIAFSPDGEILVSEIDGTVKLWDVGTWTLRQKIRLANYRFQKLSFSKDGRYLNTELLSFRYHEGRLLESDPTQYEAEQPNLIRVKSEWLTRGGKRTVWLPSNYRPTCWDVNGDTICFGNYYGMVSFLTFK